MFDEFSNFLGTFSGANLGGPVAERLIALGLPPEMGERAGFALAIAVTTYFSLVIGELVPKQLALRAAVPRCRKSRFA